MTPAEGEWVRTVGGLVAYCAEGQHFTEGPCWNLWVGLVSKRTVCAECAAEKEAK